MRSASPTRYHIVPIDARQHLFEVRCEVDDPDPSGQRFHLPVWIPGSYLVREFARHVVEITARCGERAISIDKQSKSSWRAAPCTGPLAVTATIYAYDLSVRGAYLDETRAYFNGAAVFVCPEGRERSPCEVDIVRPSEGSHWRVATTLEPVDAPRFGFGRYRADDYDALIDHPVEMASFSHVTFNAGGVPHDVTVTGRHDADLERLARDLERICQWQADLFGGTPSSRAPFARYLFQVTAVGEGYGGLEHRSSTSLLCSRNDLPSRDMPAMADDYRTLLALASHEYFHSWHIKRIKPAAFVPYDLAREAYTRQLWAFEGFTSYYDDLALVRSGVLDVAGYLELAGRTITSVLRTPGRHRQSLAQSSFDAWIKFYRPDENTPNAVVSYYAKGAVVALALDLTLRLRGSSLDALMRLLWERYGRTGIGVPEDAIPKLANECAQRDLSSFFARYVEGTDDPPLAELLREAGVVMSLRPAEGTRDRGGRAGQAPADRPSPASLAIKLATGEAKILHTFRDGAAARAGLAAGDVIVAVDGLRATPDAVERTIARRRAGERVTVHAFRRDELVAFDVTLDAAPSDTCFLTLDANAPTAAIELRRSWLGSA